MIIEKKCKEIQESSLNFMGEITTQNFKLNYDRIFIYEMTSHIQNFKFDLMGKVLHVNSVTEPALPMMREWGRIIPAHPTSELSTSSILFIVRIRELNINHIHVQTWFLNVKKNRLL